MKVANLWPLRHLIHVIRGGENDRQSHTERFDLGRFFFF